MPTAAAPRIGAIGDLHRPWERADHGDVGLVVGLALDSRVRHLDAA